jgi:ABC-type uncharacterized transport system YnjBCD permease subunit
MLLRVTEGSVAIIIYLSLRAKRGNPYLSVIASEAWQSLRKNIDKIASSFQGSQWRSYFSCSQ